MTELDRHMLADATFQLEWNSHDTQQQWLSLAANGPRMQASREQTTTDFFSDHPFQRDDEGPDSKFYHHPRFVAHIDETAGTVIRDLHGVLVHDRRKVLDFMSSWQSHLALNKHFDQVTGLGMNDEELGKNTQLSGYRVKDLNADPVLPFADGAFDAVLCSVSVEYLTFPIDVFSEVARVLEPDGIFIAVFSNRWFPPKAIRIWKELHEFHANIGEYIWK